MRKQYVIETTDGTVVFGTVIKEDSAQILLHTATIGDITVQRIHIKTIKEISPKSTVKGEYWFDNPASTRYVIGPSAIPLKKGEGYYQNLYVLVHSANVDITDHLKIGGGTEIASVIFGQQAPSFYFLTPKYGTQLKEKLYAGGGVLYIGFSPNGIFGNGGKGSHYGIAYGVLTYGTTNNNFTLGLGWNFSNKWYRDYYYDPVTGLSNNIDVNRKSAAPYPTITLSGMWRTGKRFALVTENWVFPYEKQYYVFVPNGPNTYRYEYVYQFFTGYGVRFLGEKISVDLGFVNSPEIAGDIAVGIPYIDFVIKFGGKRKAQKKN
ncbi:MAG: hypothetical protein Fur0041_10570 [Bacteroidia bacterium]